MSKENLEKFYEAVMGDAGMQEQLKVGDVLAQFANRAVELGKAKGFDFSADEVIQEVQMKGFMPLDSELSDAELEAVAGGAKPEKKTSCTGSTWWTGC